MRRMPKIVPIVEGTGDLLAVPELLKMVLISLNRTNVYIDAPLNAHGKGNLTIAGGVEKFIKNAFTRRDCGAVLVLIDADEKKNGGKCAVAQANALVKRVKQVGILFPVAVVVANCEYENWFLASLDSIKGKNWGEQSGISADAKYEGGVEDKCNVKTWLTEHLPTVRIYREAIDQAVLTRLIDIDRAKTNSRSFRRLCHAVEEMLAAIDSGEKVVTPLAKG